MTEEDAATDGRTGNVTETGKENVDWNVSFGNKAGSVKLTEEVGAASTLKEDTKRLGKSQSLVLEGDLAGRRKKCDIRQRSLTGKTTARTILRMSEQAGGGQ